MSDSSIEIVRELELRLLRCSTNNNNNNNNKAWSCSRKEKFVYGLLVEEIINMIEKGDYIGALSSDALRIVFKHGDYSIDCAQRFYLEAENNVHSFLHEEEEEEDYYYYFKPLLIMSIGVASFLAFTQNNMTGPFSEGFPAFPFPFGSPVCIGVQWDVWARNHLMSAGSDLLGKFSLLQYIIYAKMLLTKTKDFYLEGRASSFAGIKTISWWLSRLFLLQQRMSHERTSSLFDSLQVFKAETLDHFGELEKVKSYWGTLLREGEALTIVSMAHLEAGIIEYTYGRVDPSRQHFNTAEEASGLQLSVTGILGFRTIHQVEAKAQMMLVVNTDSPCIGSVCPKRSPELQRDIFTLGEDKLGSSCHEIHEASDILMIPKLSEDKKDAGTGMGANGTQNGATSTIPLEAIQQAVILARCLLIEKSTPYGEMQRWDMAPFIEAVDAQEITYFIIRCFCDVLRVRWESTRSHTKERAFLMMEKKVQSVYDSSPGAAQRIPYSFGVYVPTIPALRKEFGELLVGCGMIGEALKIFEDLELWDNLIDCYCLLEKKAAAVELIKARLCEMPNDPRLWCSLGDVTNIAAYYEKALEVSNNRSARAKRSLARSAYNRGDYEASKILWESALALNSLYPDGWFALGAAALKARDIDKALDGFTRAVQLDPDNGEAWNNIACLHMIKKKNKEAFIAFKEALKFRRNSWQLWENYSQVALDIGNYCQALEATKMVLDMTNNKRIDTDLLERIMVEMESRVSQHNLSPLASGDANCTIQNHLYDSFGDSIDETKYEERTSPWSRETEHLVEFLGKVLQQIVRGGRGEDIWGLYARWQKIKGDLTMCCEALLKQVRSYQGADLWNNRDRFKKFASASLQLCEVYMEISVSTGSRRELNAAEMHLRNTIKQALSFSEMEEFRAIQSCLDKVRKRLQATSVTSAGNP